MPLPTAARFSTLPPRQQWSTESLAINRRVLFFAATVFLGPSIITAGGGSSARTFAMATTGPTVTTGAEPVTVPRVTHNGIDLTSNDYDDYDDDDDDDDYDDDDDDDDYDDDDDDDSIIFEDSRVNPGSDSFSWEPVPYLDADSLVEGCTHPAVMTGVSVKKNAPSTGNVAALAIDGDPSTKWAVKGQKRWMDVEFEGGEGGDFLVEGLAIAFFRGDRRGAFFDVSRMDGGLSLIHI